MNKPPVGMPGIGGSLGCCALCGETFLCEIVLGKKIQQFELEGCNNTLYAHPKCIELYEGKDFTELPEASPIRQAFEKGRAKLPAS